MNVQRGFTLLETMVALVISGLMLALLFGGLSNSLQQWQRIDKVSTENHMHYLLQRHLRTQLQQAIALTDKKEIVQFSGNGHELSFVAPLEHENYNSGLFLYELSQQHTGEQSTLKLQISPYLATGKPVSHSAAEQQITLYTGPAEIRFAYASFNPDHSLRWHDQWRRQKALPHVVKISLADQSDQLHRWPELLIQIQGTGNVL